MTWLSASRRPLILGGLAVLALLLQGVLERTRTPVKQRDYELKMAAAEKAYAAYLAVRRDRQMDNATVELESDPAGTGLIGPEESKITNSPGDLVAKQTCLNPNWAAVIVDMFRHAGLKAGDSVVIAVTGSFPGLNIAVYAAVEAMELLPVVITSVSASHWGASDPLFTWLDMEKLFIKEGVFDVRSAAATLGASDDMGRGLTPTGCQMVRAAIDRNDIPLLASRDIEDAITVRMAFIEECLDGRRCRAYVNVGGGVASLGATRNKHLIKRGLSTTLGVKNWPRKGCMVRMSDKGVPVIHLLNISDLAHDYGLPQPPDYDYLATPGEGDIFKRDSYRYSLVAVFFLVYAGLCAVVLAPEVRRKLLPPFGFVRRVGDVK